MGGQTVHSSPVDPFSETCLGLDQPPGRDRRLAWPLLPGLKGQARSLCTALAMAGILLTGAASPSRAQSLDACAQGGSDEGMATDASCCPDDILSVYWPGRPQQLSQTLCQLLIFPTARLPNNEDFSRQIVDGSFSSDSRRASASTMTLPSLWWNRDSLTSQLGGRRLVQSWISYQIKVSSIPVVDVMINPQMWSVLSYNERYAVLNQFGTAARHFGYNLRFFQGNARNYRLVGVYACDFGSQSGPSAVDLDDNLDDVQTCSANLDMALLVQLQRNLLAEGERRQQSQTPTAQNVTPDSRSGDSL